MLEFNSLECAVCGHIHHLICGDQYVDSIYCIGPHYDCLNTFFIFTAQEIPFYCDHDLCHEPWKMTIKEKEE